jgi:hypothetical protein
MRGRVAATGTLGASTFIHSSPRDSIGLNGTGEIEMVPVPPTAGGCSCP